MGDFRDRREVKEDDNSYLVWQWTERPKKVD
jgi:hypothetical protein